jgi:hypothetical protein
MHLTARLHLQPPADCCSDAAGRHDVGLAFVDEVRAHVKTLAGGDAFAMVRESLKSVAYIARFFFRI